MKVEFDLGSIAGCLNNCSTLTLTQNGIDHGQVIIRIQKKTQPEEILSFRIKGTDLNFKLICFEAETNLTIQKQLIDFKPQGGKKKADHSHGDYSKVSDSPTKESWITVFEISGHDIACNQATPTLVESTLSKLCSEDPRTPLKVSDWLIVVQAACLASMLWVY